MLVVMVVSLYTSRVVLAQLGVVDYGVFNVVAGIVALLGFLNISISTAAQRFLAVAIAQNDPCELSKVFQTLQAIHLIIIAFILILGETVGLWFLFNYINIPPQSIRAAFWVFQCSIVIAGIGILTTPYTSLSISHEDMSVYAYLSFLEVFLKLCVAFLLMWIHFEKLILYGLLLVASSFITFLSWVIFARKKYPRINFSPIYNRQTCKEILSFMGWQTFGSMSLILRAQGVNIILNVFFGPVLNAARGIAVQVNTAVIKFVQNFLVAVVPQINKSYALNDNFNVNMLIMRSSKISFLLLFILSLPILMETKPILDFWLKNVPGYGVIFVQLIIIASLTDIMSGTLAYGILATGRIKVYQIIIFTLTVLAVPGVYIAYIFSYPPQTMFYIEMLINIICLIVRLCFLRKMTGLNIKVFLETITARELLVVVLSLFLAFIAKSLIPDSNWGVIFIIGISGIIACVFSVFLGLTRHERTWMYQTISHKFKRGNGTS